MLDKLPVPGRPTNLDYSRARAYCACSRCELGLFGHFFLSAITSFLSPWGWSGGANVLGKLPVPGRPTNLDYSRARAYCTCSRCGWGLLGHFFLIYHFSFLSPSLWETARYRLKYCLKGPLSPKQPTNQPDWIFCALLKNQLP